MENFHLPRSYPVSHTEHSEREKALKIPHRVIYRASYVDRSKYTGAKLREIRRINGVGRTAVVQFIRHFGRGKPYRDDWGTENFAKTIKAA